MPSSLKMDHVSREGSSLNRKTEISICSIFLFKGVLHLLPCLPKISMFCALSQNYQHRIREMIYASYSKLSKELKYGIEILVDQAEKLWIKTFKMLFGPMTQDPLRLLKV